MKILRNFNDFILESNGNYSNIQQLIDYLNDNGLFKHTTKKQLKYNFFDISDNNVDDMPPMSYGQLSSKQNVVTYTSDGEETKNQGNIGDFVMSGPSKEKYVIKQEKISKLYQGKIGEVLIPEQNPRYVAKITKELLSKFNLGSSIKFVASWGEEMILKEGDYLVKDGDKDYYRIAKLEYSKTYNDI
jgi:hypothetical protein